MESAGESVWARLFARAPKHQCVETRTVCLESRKTVRHLELVDILQAVRVELTAIGLEFTVQHAQHPSTAQRLAAG
eukprot:10284335-Heterocapsa_arctica.AAC.1